jgi:REP element-mobilizing transposase RayT
VSKFQNKYRNESARAPWWDYGRNAAYFVTICTKNRACFFGEITNGEMKFSSIGNIAKQCWIEIPEHFPFVKLGKFVIMPNHIHGIVIIDKPVGTQNFASLQQPQLSPPQNKFGPQSKNLASIIRGFKIGVTKNARIINSGFAWQSRFHDHIIRDDEEFHRISRYIKNNPANWEKDKMRSRQ